MPGHHHGALLYTSAWSWQCSSGIDLKSCSSQCTWSARTTWNTRSHGSNRGTREPWHAGCSRQSCETPLSCSVDMIRTASSKISNPVSLLFLAAHFVLESPELFCRRAFVCWTSSWVVLSSCIACGSSEIFPADSKCLTGFHWSTRACRSTRNSWKGGYTPACVKSDLS